MPKHSRLTWSATTIQRLPPILFACLLTSLSLVWHGLCWSRRPRNDNFIGTAIIYGRPIPPTLLSVQSSCVPSNYIRVTAATQVAWPRKGYFALLGVEMIAISIFPFNVSLSESRVPGTVHSGSRWLFRVRPYILHGGRVLIRSQFVISCRLVSPINPPEPTTGN